MIEGLAPTHISEFNGWFSRGPAEIVPPGHFTQARNLRYLTGGFETRYGTTLSVSVPIGVLRWFPYSIEGQTNRIIYLTSQGLLYDSLFPNTAILNIPTMQDFSMVVINDRAYISPHNRVAGLAGEKVWMYQGAGSAARHAGGTAPVSGAIASATSPLAGSVEAGRHNYAVVFETDSGFLTKPGAIHTAIAPGNFRNRITNVPIGPAGTVARHILATKVVPSDEINPYDSEWFFVDGGKISDNFTDQIDVSFFDADLVKSADYLLDQMETIPAFLGMALFAGSLVGWAPNTEPTSVYISLAGEPESISLLEGLIEVDAKSGGGVKNCVEYRGQLMIHKSSRVYQINSNGQEPVYWGKPILVDHGLGTEVFGVATILDEEGNTTDKYIFGSRKGIIAYNGTFENNLTSKIDDIWKRINKVVFNTIQLAYDSINECLYAAVPLDGATSPNSILFGDCQKGMDPVNIAWSLWEFPYNPTSIGIDVDTQQRPVFKIGSRDGSIYYLNPAAFSDGNSQIPDPTFQTHWIGDEENAVNQFGGVRIAVEGVGFLQLEVYGHGETIPVVPPQLTIPSTAKKHLQREFNVTSQYAAIRFFTSDFGERFQITRIIVYSAPIYLDEPQ